MALSMTGYGRAEFETSGRRIVVEGKSVNHRYLEVNIKAPCRPFQMEEMIRKAVKAKFSRGYFEITITVGPVAQAPASVTVNETVLAGYLKAASHIAEKHGIAYPPSFGDLLMLKDVFAVSSDDFSLEENWPVLEEPFANVLGQIEAMRKAEGDIAAGDIRARLTKIASLMERIAVESVKSVKDRRDKLKARMDKLLEDSSADPSRIAQEAAILADRSDVSEEMERLRSHMTQVDALFKNGGQAGRKLEFFLQEMNREANTLGSKAAAPEITADVVEIKSEMEKIREQAQNLE